MPARMQYLVCEVDIYLLIDVHRSGSMLDEKFIRRKEIFVLSR